MSDLTTRLLTAIEETERDAKDMPYDRPGQWWVEKTPMAWGESSRIYIASSGGMIAEVADEAALAADHIARQDPDTVLRRCAADRKIIDEHYDNGGFQYDTDGVTLVRSGPIGTKCITCVADEREIGSEFSEMAAYPCKTLVLLAEGYGITEETSP